MWFKRLCTENYCCARHTGSSINRPHTTAMCAVYGKTAIAKNIKPESTPCCWERSEQQATGGPRVCKCVSGWHRYVATHWLQGEKFSVTWILESTLLSVGTKWCSNVFLADIWPLRINSALFDSSKAKTLADSVYSIWAWHFRRLEEKNI